MARCWSGAHGQGDRTCGVGTSHPELVGMRWGGGAAQGPGSFTPSSPPHPLCPSLPSDQRSPEPQNSFPLGRAGRDPQELRTFFSCFGGEVG